MNDFVREILNCRTKPRNWTGEGFVQVEEKYDGHRVTIVSIDGFYYAFGRWPDINLWPKLAKHPIIQCWDIPNGSAVDGELYCPGGGSQDVKTAINNGSGWDFVAFDVPFYRSVRNTFSGGLKGFEERDNLLNSMGFKVPVTMKGFPWMGHSKFEAMQETLVRSAKALGIEGYVVKASASHAWWKVKPVRTVDCIVLSLNPGAVGTKYENTLGSIRVGVYDEFKGIVEIANVSGMSDAERKSIWNQAEFIPVGKVIEVAYDCIQVSRLRFPRFIRFRDDKLASECMLDQLKD